MPKRVQTIPVSDFQGGLNLNADAFQLAKNESPDLLNVDLDPLGGFRRRSTVQWRADMSYPVKSLWGFSRGPSATGMFMTEQNGNIKYSLITSVGSTWTSVPSSTVTWTPTGAGYPMMGISFRNPANFSLNNCYIQRGGVNSVVRWEGGVVNATELGVAYSEDIDAPTDGNMPKAKFITSHRDFVFVANTTESSIVHGSRIRWSHRGRPESWRSLDYIDIEPGTADHITAIVSWQDRLLVFKQNSTFMVSGYSNDTFEVVNISRTVGTISQNSIAVSDNGVFFFSWPYGVQFFDGEKIDDVFANLRPLIQSNDITDATSVGISLAWMDQKLYVSLPSGGAVETVGNVSYTYVLDPLLSGTGWTRHQYEGKGIGVSLYLSDELGNSESLMTLRSAYTAGPQIVIQPLESNALFGDVLRTTSGTTTVDIASYYRTAWQDIDNAAIVKSWGRPIVVLDNANNYILKCDAYKDYDSNFIAKYFNLNSVNSAGNFTWGPGVGTSSWVPAVYDPLDPTLTRWESETGPKLTIEKGGRLGRATSVALQINGPEEQTPWSVNSITWKFIQKKVRS